MTTDVELRRARPEAIKAVPVRHPGRWLAVVCLAVLAAMFVHLLATNTGFHWSYMINHMFRPPVMEGVRGTIVLTIFSMVMGILLGIALAVMRLSPNPVLSGMAWVYIWFFRAVPRLVLAILFGNVGILWTRVEFGLPFDRELGSLFGIDDLNARFYGVDSRTVLSGFAAGLLALGLSEAAYMAEIVRAGIQSVESGQSEAAEALGMRRGQLLRRIVLPQAMRVIIPPTGNEMIAMLKDTSLVAFVPVTAELFFQLKEIGTRDFLPFPMLVAATLWYLVLSSGLLVGQFYLERHFSRGYGTAQRARRRLRMITAETGSVISAPGDAA